METDGGARRTFLLSQYEYAKTYDLQHRGFLYTVAGAVFATLMVGFPLWIGHLLGLLDMDRKVVGIAFVALSTILIAANLIFALIAGRTFINDLNALLIEDVLGMADIGLWHQWYDLKRGMRAPSKSSVAAHFCGLSRTTSYLDGFVLFTGFISAFLWIAIAIAVGASSVGSIWVAGAVALVLSLANVAAQGALIRHLIRNTSPIFRSVVQEFGLQPAWKAEGSPSPGNHEQAAGPP